jgi:hypothetical protein
MYFILECYRLSTTATTFGVRVIEFEAGAMQPIDVVDGGAFQIVNGHHIHHNLDAVLFQNFIGVRDLIVEVDVGVKPSTASALDTYTNNSMTDALGFGNLFNLGNGFFSNSNHGASQEDSKPSQIWEGIE